LLWNYHAAFWTQDISRWTALLPPDSTVYLIFSPLTVGLAFLNSHPRPAASQSLIIRDRYADNLVQLYNMLLFRVRGGQVAIVSGDDGDAISTFECHG
jgi:hypothetical protein